MTKFLRTDTFALLILCTLAAGCGVKDDTVAATQVAAKVNETEITVSQVNTVLSRTPDVTPTSEPRIKREILDTLIDQQLARQQALDAKLDRTPNVLQTLEAAKTEILARAYVERIAAAQPRPTPEEVKKYYDEHPALFSQRRVFNIEELTTPAKEGIAERIRAQAAKTSRLQDVAAMLKADDIKFTANNALRSAEQLPLDVLDRLQSMKDGEIAVFEARGGVQAIRVAASKSAPVSEAVAAPKINQYLFNQRLNAALLSEMKQVKDNAKIEYVGEFAVAVADAEAKARTEAEARARRDAEAQAKVDAAAAARTQAIAESAAEAQERADARAKARAEDEEERRKAAAGRALSAPAPLPAETIQKGIR